MSKIDIFMERFLAVCGVLVISGITLVLLAITVKIVILMFV